MQKRSLNCKKLYPPSEERSLSHLECLRLIQDGEAWMDMIQGRNLTTHTYDEATAALIISSVRSRYLAEFIALQQVLDALCKEEEL